LLYAWRLSWFKIYPHADAIQRKSKKYSKRKKNNDKKDDGGYNACSYVHTFFGLFIANPPYAMIGSTSTSPQTTTVTTQGPTNGNYLNNAFFGVL
jgi:hypothetical protein